MYSPLKVVPDVRNLIRYWDPLYLQALIIDCGTDPTSGEEDVRPVTLPEGIFRNAAIMISHAHADHTLLLTEKPGGVLFYGTEIVHTFLEQEARDFEDRRALGGVLRDMRLFSPGTSIQIGKLHVDTIPLSHSVPESSAFFFTLGGKNVLHLGEFKFESRNPAFRPAFEARLEQIGPQGLELLVLDVQNIADDCHTPSEQVAIDGIAPLIREARGRVVISLFGSNVERVEALVDIAHSCNRPVSFLGAGMRKAQAVLGLAGNPNLEHPRAVIFVSGCQGEENSTLLRASIRDHRDLRLRRSDRVILSARAIPGSEERVRNLCRNLLSLNVELIVHEGQCKKLAIQAREAKTHVSGHASGKDVRLALELLRPKAVLAKPSDPAIQAEFRELVREILPATTVLREEDLLF